MCVCVCGGGGGGGFDLISSTSYSVYRAPMDTSTTNLQPHKNSFGEFRSVVKPPLGSVDGAILVVIREPGCSGFTCVALNSTGSSTLGI